MTLILKPDEGGPAPGTGEIFNVYSGGMIVGRITHHLSGGHLSGTWAFTISFTGRKKPGLPMNAGGFATRAEAMTAFRETWQAWLEWAGLREGS